MPTCCPVPAGALAARLEFTMSNDTLVINADIAETRVAYIEDGKLADLFIERERDRSPVGNVYLGTVTRVLPGMQAAFIDIGLDRAAFLHVEDLIPAESADQLLATDETEENAGGGADSDAGEAPEEKPQPKPRSRRDRGALRKVSRSTPIQQVVQEGQSLLVQVSKGPIGTKGARVTGHVSLPGRFVIYLPTVEHIGISKRIGNDRERTRLREAIEAVKPPRGGFVVRTLASGLTRKTLKGDVGYLVRQWEQILARREQIKTAPALLYEDLDIVLRTARDYFTENVRKIVLDSQSEFDRLRTFLAVFMPERVNDIEFYGERDPIFDEYGIEDEIARATSRRVPLPSGGYLIFDQTEALTTIDVNTGRFTGRGKDVEETIYETNLEAVNEIAYQVRLRNIGGLIVLDFIDMEKIGNRERVHRALVKALKRDRATTTITRVSDLGLIEMTRKRTRESLGRTLYEPCFYCDGTGQLQSKVTICHEIVRQIAREKDGLSGYRITINAHPAICDTLRREHRKALEEASNRVQRQIAVRPRREYHLEQFDLQGS